MHETGIVIVGAGIAGLTAALILQEAGRVVSVLERAEQIGGRVRSIADSGNETLRFDGGPTWIWPLNRLRSSDHFRLGVSGWRTGDALGSIKIPLEGFAKAVVSPGPVAIKVLNSGGDLLPNGLFHFSESSVESPRSRVQKIQYKCYLGLGVLW
ncbi:NAD(P)-binding protein [Aliiruegeria haliotis]|uniref:FAD-dependent oxidoreductase n=1 Tax=Aliiruegeria haliotis TaxID=1280846 RepID=UPI0013050486